MKSHEESRFTPGQLLLESMYLIPGTKIKLLKHSATEKSDIIPGKVLEGVLDEEVEIGTPIYLDNKSKNTSPVVAVKKENGKIFIKTQTSVYEFISPGVESSEVKSQETIFIEKNIEDKLKIAQMNIVSGDEILKLEEKRWQLGNLVKSQQVNAEIIKIDEEIKKHLVTVDTISEFKILLEKLNRNHYWTMGTLAHENAHANMAESIGGTHSGYSIVVYRDRTNPDGFGYQPIAHTNPSDLKDEKKNIENEIRITNAPKEYGNKLSPGDEEKIEALKRHLDSL